MKYDTHVIRLGTVAIKVLVLVLLALISVLVGMLLQRADSLPEIGFLSNGFAQEQLAPNSLEVESITAFAATVDQIDTEQNTLVVTLLGGERATLDYLDGTVFVRNVELSDEEFQAAEQAYLEALSSGTGEVPELPEPVREEEITENDVVAGNQVFLSVVENALETKDLTAERVVVSTAE